MGLHGIYSLNEVPRQVNQVNHWEQEVYFPTRKQNSLTQYKHISKICFLAPVLAQPHQLCKPCQAPRSGPLTVS